jgi:Tol biopolymer transport system component
MKSGETLGPYRVLEKLGEGGMGEVYRARDTRLNRDVAVKVLPDLFARDAERLTRFTREAQALAALNHPNVAQIYGVVDGDGGVALAMEFAGGEDLTQRLGRGAIPVEETVAIAVQIACGLEAAHERGIVHRDLKPGNLRLAPDGTVKILDFGLAKAMDANGSSDADPLNSPTFTSPARLRQGFGEAGTEAGVILGTAAYMSPEQARGRPVDKRTDIWAFGCVVYEMLTAKRPFGGDTVTDALASIVKEDPDWSALPPETPASLRDLLRRCLIKDPKQRLRDIGEARITLEAIGANPAAESALTSSVPAVPRRTLTLAIVAGIAIVAALASVVTWMLVQPAPSTAAPMVRFVTPVPLEALPLRVGGTGVAFAPDGSSVIYAAQPALTSGSVLFRRRLNALDVEKIPNTDGAAAPFFSPDGRSIGFITDAAVMKLSVDGEGISKICDRTRFSRAAWAPDGTIVLGTSQGNSNGPLARVPASGGTPVDLTALAGKETAHQLPHVLPDGRSLLFTVISPGRSELAVVPLSGGPHRLLGVEGSGPLFVAPGHVLFARGRSMFAAPFDLRRNEFTGSPVQVLDDAGVLSIVAGVWIPMVGVDRAGSVAYLNKAGTLSTLRWIAPTSVTIPVPDGDYRTPKLSPDGRRLVAAAGTAPTEIWAVDLDRGTRLLISSNGGASAVWSHDGQRIIYSASTGDTMSVPADGSGTPELILARQPPTSVVPTSVAPDGSFIVVNTENRSGSGGIRNRDIAIVRRGEKPVPIVATPADDRGGVVSPDGKWLTYSSSVSGREEIYVKALAPAGRTIPISVVGGTLPRWPRMDSLYFLGPRTLMRVAVSADPLAVDAPVEAAAMPPNTGGFDVHADGRILVIEPRAGGTGTRDALHVLLNWGRSLK